MTSRLPLPSSMLRLPFALLSALLLFAVAGPLGAEGSRELIDFEIAQGGNARYGLQSRDLNNTDVPNWVIFQVYAQAGETIHLGSNTIHTDNGNIYLWDPSTPVVSGTFPAPLFASALVDCVAQAAGDTTVGRIDTRAKELAGPESTPGDGGYVSCRHTATTPGLYSVFFRALMDDGANAGNMPADDPNIGTQATTGVHAWDVTVRDAGGADLPGRLMATWMTFYENGGGGPDQQLYVLTRDGHLYRSTFDEVDGLGFNTFSNNKGVQDRATGEPTYRSWPSADVIDPGDPQFFHPPIAPDTATDVSNRLFVNPPDPTVISGPQGLGERLGYRAAPDFLPGPTDFVFDGSLSGGGVATAPNGFTDAVFTFDSDPSLDGIRFQLVIDTDRNGSFDDAVDRRLGGVFDSAGNSVPYDGQDASGAPLTFDSVYTARIEGTGAEIHFPFLDVENFPGGMQFERLTNPGDGDVFRAAYDDFNGAALTNTTPVSLPGGGDSSAAGFHSWTGNSGNVDVIDTWTFAAVTAPALTQFAIGAPPMADLQVTKQADVDSVQPGDSIFYLVQVTNLSDTVAVPDAVVTDLLPTGLTLVTTVGCAEDPVGVPTCSLGNVPPLGSASYLIETVVDDSVDEAIVNSASVSSVTVSDPVPSNDAGLSSVRVGSIVDVPTLDAVGLLIMGLLAAAAALWMLRRAP